MTERARRRHRPRWATRSSTMLTLYRTGVALLGGLVLAVGIVLIPYPGPGWLVVFGGLTILAAEFRWAHVVLAFLKDRYDAWRGWIRRQHPVVRVTTYAFTCLVVLATLWLLNVFTLVGGWIGLHQNWLASPFFR
ncbi:MAG: TIGR02611 family protein [Labedaea sp.]